MPRIAPRRKEALMLCLGFEPGKLSSLHVVFHTKKTERVCHTLAHTIQQHSKKNCKSHITTIHHIATQHTISHHTTIQHITQYHNTAHHTIPQHSTSHNTAHTPYHNTPHHTIPQHSTSHHCCLNNHPLSTNLCLFHQLSPSFICTPNKHANPSVPTYSLI